jgi:hypothetical protein
LQQQLYLYLSHDECPFYGKEGKWCLHIWRQFKAFQVADAKLSEGLRFISWLWCRCLLFMTEREMERERKLELAGEIPADRI